MALPFVAPLGLNDESVPPSLRGSMIATYVLLLEAARRPAPQGVARCSTDAYLETVGGLLALPGSTDPPGEAELLIAATDGLRIEQLTAAMGGDLAPRLRRFATALVVKC